MLYLPWHFHLFMAVLMKPSRDFMESPQNPQILGPATGMWQQIGETQC